MLYIMQRKITIELVKGVTKRDITITRNYLKTNHVRKVERFLTTYEN